MDVTGSTVDAMNVRKTSVFARATATAEEVSWYGVLYRVTLVPGSWLSESIWLGNAISLAVFPFMNANRRLTLFQSHRSHLHSYSTTAVCRCLSMDCSITRSFSNRTSLEYPGPSHSTTPAGYVGSARRFWIQEWYARPRRNIQKILFVQCTGAVLLSECQTENILGINFSMFCWMGPTSRTDTILIF